MSTSDEGQNEGCVAHDNYSLNKQIDSAFQEVFAARSANLPHLVFSLAERIPSRLHKTPWALNWLNATDMHDVWATAFAELGFTDAELVGKFPDLSIVVHRDNRTYRMSSGNALIYLTKFSAHDVRRMFDPKNWKTFDAVTWLDEYRKIHQQELDSDV